MLDFKYLGHKKYLQETNARYFGYHLCASNSWLQKSCLSCSVCCILELLLWPWHSRPKEHTLAQETRWCSLSKSFRHSVSGAQKVWTWASSFTRHGETQAGFKLPLWIPYLWDGDHPSFAGLWWGLDELRCIKHLGRGAWPLETDAVAFLSWLLPSLGQQKFCSSWQ